MSRPTIALASRELHPFLGGGIGAYVAQTARTLAPVADVTILTASWFQAEYHERRAAGDPLVDYGGARVAFVPVPTADEVGGFCSHMHAYSHRVLEQLRALYPDRGPDLLECSDYLGEAFVATQARRSADPFLQPTTIAVRLHTTGEICNVLNGWMGTDFESRAHREQERRSLRDADVIVYSGGDIYGTYERYYGPEQLAPPLRIRYPMDWPDGPPTAPPATDGPLRLIYVGRCERRKGVQDLIAALTALPQDWHLTILGGDTDTAPLEQSMRRTLQLQAAGDARITFLENVPRADVPAQMTAHDLVVVPSRWECWPYVALEALAAGMPILATPVGGLREMIAPGVTGWLAPTTGTDALIQALEPLVADPARARAPRDPDAVRAHLRDLADADTFREAYLDLATGGGHDRAWPQAPKRSAVAGGTPLVSIVIPYFRLPRFLTDAVASAFAQTHPRIEVIVVSDGSFDADDVVLAQLATRYPLRVIGQENRGLGGARNTGIRLSRGRYVLPLDADNILEPTFVARAVVLLEADEELAYVTAWNRYVDEHGVPLGPDEGYRPLGNWSELVEDRNVAGDATAVIRRSVLDRHRFSEDLTSYEDWALYRELRRAGRYGHVIPEMLWRYRVRADSMLRRVGQRHEERLRGEMDALIREQEVAWVSRNG